MSLSFGITAYGCYVPKTYVSTQVVADYYKFEGDFCNAKKSIALADEDSFTMTVAAVAKISQLEIMEAVYVGSESHPYSVKSTSAMVADYFNWGPSVFAADVEFACKSGTSAMQIVYAQLKAGMIENGLAVGVDIAQAGCGDVLKLTSGAGAAAFTLGKENIIAEVIKTKSFCTDTSDFWRHQGEAVPRHAGRFTGEPGYFRHVEGCIDLLFKDSEITCSDIDHFVFHNPNAGFGTKVAKKLGLAEEKLEAGCLFNELGNAYSATSMLGLASVLDIAKPGDLICLVSYGSGAGADGFILRVTDMILEWRKKVGFTPLAKQFASRTELSLQDYLKLNNG